MNHIYRIVWNATLGTWVAVCESARGRGKHGKGSTRGGHSAAIAAMALAGGMLAPPMALAQAPSAIVAPGGRANAYVAPNGVTVVNIDTANAAGLSHNRFQQFNVDPKGLVLNNTNTRQAAYQSQLAGQVMANYNMVDPARVILNEVVSNNRSTLAGFTEVLGGRADVVLANPYGITCTGCGFINTDRVTLSTGTPFFNANGGLGGFNVNQGDIVIAGTGLNGTAQQILDLVTRSVRIDGALNAQDLGIFTGANQWDYGTRAVTGSTGAQGTAPVYAIDSSALGGMYANRIRLTATENGVGVRMLGDAAASVDDFTLSAAGRVELRNRISAQRDVLVASSSSDASAIALADATLTAARNAGVSASAGGLALDRSAVIAGGDLNASAARIDAAQGARLQAAGALDVSATAGDLSLGAAAVRAGGDLHLASAGAISTAGGEDQGVQSTQGRVAIDAATGLANGGVITADRGSVTVRAGGLIANAGKVNAGADLDIADAGGGASQSIANQGELLAGQAMTTRAAAIDNSGWMQAGTTNTVEATTLDNSGKLIAVTGTAMLRVADTLDNSGSVRAAQDIVVAGLGGNALRQLNNGGDMLAARAMDLRSSTLTNGASGWLQAAAGSTAHADTIDNAGTWLLSQEAAAAADQITASGTLTNTGVVQSAGSATVHADRVDNRGVLAADGALTVGARSGLENGADAVVQAGGALSVASGGTIANAADGTLAGTGIALAATLGIDNGGAIVATNDAALRTDGTLDNSGQIRAGGAVEAGGLGGSASAAFANSGVLLAGGTLTLDTASATNAAGGHVQAAAGSDIAAQTLRNDGTWLLSTTATGEASQVSVSGTLSNTGILQAQQNAAVTANRFENEATALLRTGGDLQMTVSASDGLRNAGTVQAGGALGIDGIATALANTAGGQLLGDRLAFRLAALDNAGTLQGGTGATTIDVAGTLNNGGVITAGVASQAAAAGAGRISAGLIANSGTVQSQGSLAIALGTGGLSGTGNLLSDADLGIEARDANAYAIVIGGTLQAGGQFKVRGNGGSALSFDAGRSATAGSIDIDTGSVQLAKDAVLAATGGLLLKADELALAGDAQSTARILAALDGNAGDGATVAVRNALANDGLVFSATNLDVTAPSINVGKTGALSALGNLSVTATTGDLTNSGLLYAGGDLTAQAEGTLTNANEAGSTIALGTINAVGQVTLSADTVVNQSDIVGKNISIAANTIRNTVMGGGERRLSDTQQGSSDVFRREVGCHHNTNKCWRNYYTTTWYQDEEYVTAPTYKPQILADSASGTVDLRFAATLENKGGLISGDAVNLTGTADGASFVNDDLALRRQSFAADYYHYRQERGAGGGLLDFEGYFPDAPGQAGNEEQDETRSREQVIAEMRRLTEASVLSSFGAGVRARALTATGFALYNNGSTTGVAADDGTIQAAKAAEAPGSQGLRAPTGTNGPERQSGAGTADLALSAGLFSGPARGSSATRVSGQSFLDANAANGVRGTSFGGIDITLPVNPNGLFVTAKTPGARYLVESNPLYLMGSATFGSDYLAGLLGYNPDEIGLRLGDASYEAYLVRQQLIAQTGSVVLAGYRSADTQMQGLMEHAATQSASLGLEYGKALTPQQQSALTQDIVWMVQTEIAGKTVLTPVVYLAQSTKATIASGAVISAEVANMSLTSLTNTGGTIIGSKSLVVASTGDISNLSGLIKGGDVTLTSTEGSIVNKTLAESGGNDLHYDTVIGKTAGIESTGTLALDAKKDITNLGATMAAGTDATLKAGGDIVFDTLEKRSTDTTREKYIVEHGSGTTVSTTAKTEQIKSGLTVGGSLDATAGNDITFAGTDVKVDGNARLEAGNDINIVARENSTATHTESKASGFGMNNSLWGSTKTTTDTESVRNVGSTFQVGGDAALQAARGITVQGSDVQVEGKGTVVSQTFDILAGRNSDTTATTTTNKGVLGVSGNGKDDGHRNTSAGTAVATGSGSASAKDGVAAASGSGQATAGGKASGGLHFSTSTTTTTETENTTHVGSSVSFGGAADLQVRDSLTLEGSQLSSGGRMDIAATDVNVLTVEDVATSKTTSTTTTIGLLGSTDNKVGVNGSAGVQAVGGKGRTPGVEGSAAAGASVSSYNELNFVDVRKESSSTKDLTHQGSSISSGGDLNIQAANVLVSGSELAAAKDVTIDAKNQRFEAVDDVHETTASSDRTTFGMYVSGSASASGQAAGEAGLGVNYKASGSAKAEAGAGVHGTNDKSSTLEGSTTAKTSSIRAGGNVNRNAEDGTITDVGTSIEAGGDLNQKAATWTSLAAENTTYGTQTSERTDARVGLYANAGASAESSQGLGTGAGSTITDSGVGAGVRASVEHQRAKDTTDSSTAVVSSIKVGGSVNSRTSGTTTLQGTQIEAAQDVTLGAQTLEIKAAQNTATADGMDMKVGVSAEVDLVKRKAGGSASGSGGTTSSESSTAVVANIKAGKQLALQSDRDMTLEGTQLAAGGGAAIDAGGKLDFQAAESTSESHSKQGGGGVKVGASESSDAAKGTSSSSRSGGVSVNYQQADSESSTATVGSLTAGGPVSIRSGGDATFTGTQIASDGPASVAAGGALTFEAAHSTSKSTGGGFSLDANGKNADKADGSSATNTKSGSGNVGINYGKNQSDTAQVASIASGGGLALSSGGDMTLVGTQAKAEGQLSIDAGGAFIEKEVKSTSKRAGFELSASASGSTSTQTPAPSAPPAVPSPPTTGPTPSSKPPAAPPPLRPDQKPGINPKPPSTLAPAPGSKPPSTPPPTPAPTPGVNPKPPAAAPATPAIPAPPAPPAPPAASPPPPDGPPPEERHGGGNLSVVNKNSSSTQTTSLSGGQGVVIRSGGNTAAGAQIQASVPIPAGLPPGRQAAASTADGKPLPAWLRFDPASGTFQGQPPADFKGELKVQVSVPQPDGSVKTVPMSFAGR
jgi:filamentous hemagglutinin